MKKPWVRFSLWNTFEHLMIRGSDAFISLLLIWYLPSEQFATVLGAQALSAVLLFLFISPAEVIYRDFSLWKMEGPSSLAARLYWIRRYCRTILAASVVLSAFLAALSTFHGSFYDRFFSLVRAFFLISWAFASGADREFLKLEMRGFEVNRFTLIFKSMVLFGSWGTLIYFPGRLDILAIASIIPVFFQSTWLNLHVNSLLTTIGASRESLRGNGFSFKKIITSSFKEFSISSSLTSYIWNLVQSLDVFFLGLFGVAANLIGLYGSSLKVANLLFLLPTLGRELFSVWLGRRVQPTELIEKKMAKKIMTASFLTTALASLVLIAFGEWILTFFSHGRWTTSEIQEMTLWLKRFSISVMLLSPVPIAHAYVAIRKSVNQLFFKVYLPWLLFSVGVYAYFAQSKNVNHVATANIIIAAELSFTLLLMFAVRSKQKSY